ncbi:MAG: NTP transferase domain-containing protein [Clostridiales bacterium]|nr:NTP transferase domain-containing protein [Clostridiales bacterium]
MTTALIVASGKTNSKTKFEPTKVVGTITAAERIFILLRQAGIQRIVVVSDEEDKLQKNHSSSSADITFLPSPADGEMLDSIKAGLAYLDGKCTQVLIVYVDVPMFSVETIHSLIEAEGGVCIPSYRGQWGHPILLRAEHFHEILAYHGQHGLRGAIEQAGIGKQIVEVDDPGVRADIQRGKSYEKLLPMHDAARLRVSCQIGIGKERIFYNDEVHRLLRLVEELGSLSKACAYTGISLNKGRTIISTIEQQMGHPVLETQQGGKNGGYSHLTEEMKVLMSRYDGFSREADGFLQQLFEKYFISDK